MSLRACLYAALLLPLLAACDGGRATTPSVPSASPTPDVAGLALASYGAAISGPSDAATLWRAFDQVELALAMAPAGRGRDELLAAEGKLVEQLALIEEEARTTPLDVPTPVPTAPPAGVASTPTAVTAPARRMPTPTAAAPAFTVAGRKSFEGSGASGQFASCIDVQVLDDGAPVAGAVLGINNGDLSYQNQTDRGGYSGRCGLGASTWSVVLFWTPARGAVQGAATTIYLSGAPEQRGAVVFAAK